MNFQNIKTAENKSKIPCVYLDPRTKLAVLVLINIVVFTATSLWVEVLCITLISITLIAMRSYHEAVRGVIMYLVLLAALLFCTLNDSYFSSAISMVVLTLRKLLPTIFFASGIIATTKVNDLIYALQKMHLPKSLVITFAVTLRFFPTVKEEYRYIKDAMCMRGIQLNAKNILTHPIAMSEYIFIPTMLRCASIADELSEAATTRGIESEGNRTSLYNLTISGWDYAIFAVFLILCGYSVLGGVLVW